MRSERGYKEWLETYFPVKPSKKMTWEEAVAHCIRKWRGADWKVLEKYSAIKGSTDAIFFEFSDRVFHFDSTSCALCVKTGLERNDCEPCPLYHARGRVECCAMKKEEWLSPHAAFVENGNVSEMLKWLGLTQRFLKTKKWKKIQSEFRSNRKHKGILK